MNFRKFVIVSHFLIVISINVSDAMPAREEDSEIPSSSTQKSSELGGSSGTPKIGWKTTSAPLPAGSVKSSKLPGVPKMRKSYAQALVIGPPTPKKDKSTTENAESMSKAAKRNMKRHESRRKQKALAQEDSVDSSPNEVLDVEGKFVEETFSPETLNEEISRDLSKSKKEKEKGQSVKKKSSASIHDAGPTQMASTSLSTDRFEENEVQVKKEETEMGDSVKYFFETRVRSPESTVSKEEKRRNLSQSQGRVNEKSANKAAANDARKYKESFTTPVDSSVQDNSNISSSERDEGRNEERGASTSKKDDNTKPADIFIPSPMRNRKSVPKLEVEKVRDLTDERLIAKSYRDQILHESNQSTERSSSSSPVEENSSPHRSSPAKSSKQHQPHNNVLLIQSKIAGIDAHLRLQNSDINPNNFGAVDVVRLLNSGVIVKCSTETGALNLGRAILNEFKELSVDSLTFSFHILCVHDVPYDSTDAQIYYTIYRKYRKIPKRIYFVRYELSRSQHRKIALLDVDDSLYNKMKIAPTIKVRWNDRKLFIISLSDQDNLEVLEAQPSAETEEFDMLIRDLTEDVTDEEVIKSIFDKYGETPLNVQFIPNGRKNRKMATIIVDHSLLDRIISSPWVKIRSSEKQICTFCPVYRCSNCQLLGHMGKSCQAESRPPPNIDENCLDCCDYKRRHGEVEGKYRDENHGTDADECPTRVMYMLDCLKQSRSVGIAAGEKSNGSEGLEQEFSNEFPETSSPVTSLPSSRSFQRSLSASSSNLADDEKFRETIEQSILSKMLPLLNKSVAEAVDQSMQENLSKMLPTIRQDEEEPKRPEVNKNALLIKARVPGTDVLRELGRMRFDSEKFAVERAVIYPVSGDLLIICNSVEGANYLRGIIGAQALKLRVVSWRGFNIKARIDFIPQECTDRQVSYYILQKFNELPDKIIFKPYRNPWDENLKIAILLVSESLLKKIQASPTIQIDGSPRKIDTSFWPGRCEKCQLLGHRPDTCRSVARPRPQYQEPCIDCAHYNRLLSRTGFRYRLRNITHPTGHESCPTRISFTTNQNYQDY